MVLSGGTNSERVRLLSVKLKPVDGDWMTLAIDAPAGWDREGEYIDLGPCLREAFGGGLLVALGCELELRVRWRTVPVIDEEAEDVE